MATFSSLYHQFQRIQQPSHKYTCRQNTIAHKSLKLYYLKLKKKSSLSMNLQQWRAECLPPLPEALGSPLRRRKRKKRTSGNKGAGSSECLHQHRVLSPAPALSRDLYSPVVLVLSVTPALRRWKQEGQFKIILGY